MKNLVNNYKTLPLHDRVLWVVYVLAIAVVGFALTAGDARAQAGNVFAVPQAQRVGDSYEAVVLQVSIKEVEPSFQARAAGAAVGSAAGLLAASRASTRSPWAVNTAAAVVGGLLGERTANAVMTTHAQEIILRMQKGNTTRTVVIVQPAPFDAVQAGEPVYVTVIGGTYRVLKRLL